MTMFAGGVALPPDLKQALSGVGAGGTSGINDIYAKQKQRMDQEAATKVPGNVNSYGPQRMATQQGLDQGNLEAALGGTLGDTGYNNALQEREFGQNEALARQIGSLNKPDLLQQILSGIGNVGSPIATYYGLKGNKPSFTAGNQPFPQGQSYMNPPVSYPMYGGNY